MKWFLSFAVALAVAAAGLWLTTQALPPPAAPVTKEAPPVPTRSRAELLREEPLPAPFSTLVATATPKTPPGPHDWLANQEEAGQSLADFRREAVSAKGRVVYLVPAGRLDPPHAAVVDALGPLMRAWLQLEVKRLPPIGDEEAKVGQRQGPQGTQWFTRTLLEAALQRRPSDAAAVMALTQVDLYPDPTWNFVFGEASYEERVGVSSLARDGDATAERGLVLRRSFATSVHEVGHMLGLTHCIAWECAMNGSNHRDEADSRPLEPCPVCQAKLQQAIGFDPAARWEALEGAYADAGFDDGAQAVREALGLGTADGGR